VSVSVGASVSEGVGVSVGVSVGLSVKCHGLDTSVVVEDLCSDSK